MRLRPRQVRERFGDAADAVRILYGGCGEGRERRRSIAEPDIDGALVGGASLEPAVLRRIVRFVEPV